MLTLSRALPRLVLGFAVVIAAAAPALAHAILEASYPETGGKVRAGTIAMQFRYNSRIDRARSRLVLTRPDQSRLTLPIAPGGPPDIINSSADLKPGAYVIRWQVLAVDGHITRGDVPFTVTEP